jgi:hypothetical protein
MDRSGRIGEERREDKPKPQPPRGEGKQPSPAPEKSLRPEGNANPDEKHAPEDPLGTTAA